MNTRPKQKRWSLDEIKIVKQMVASGHSNKEIAKKLNRTKSSLDNVLTRLGLTRKKGTNQYSFNPESKNGMCGKHHTEETKRKIAESREKYIMSRHPGWKGGKRENQNGYIVIRAPEHPRSVNGYIFEHILIMEAMLGRYLTKEEVVHHINEDKKDNRPENLMLFKNDNDHKKYHAFMRREKEYCA